MQWGKSYQMFKEIRKHFRLGTIFLLSVTLLLLQIAEAGIIRSLRNQIESLLFGPTALLLALQSGLLGMVSGMVLMWLLPLQEVDLGKGKLSSNILMIVFLTGGVPLMLFLYRLLLSSSDATYALTQIWGRYKFVVFDWVMYSQAIPMWFGIAVGFAVKVVIQVKRIPEEEQKIIGND